MNADGTSLGLVAGIPDPMGFPQWSPDGLTLYYLDYSRFYSVPADGSAAPRLLAQQVIGFSVSPVSGALAYIVQTTPVVQYWLYILPADGTPTMVINAVPAVGAVSWSPDGVWVAFIGWDAGVPGALKIIRPDGSGLTKLTQSSGVGTLAWSPHGRQIAFDTLGERSEIVIVSVDGLGLRRIGGGSLSMTAPRWSPAGTTLVFTGYDRQEGLPYVYTVNPDGTELAPLAVGLDAMWKP